MCTKRRTPAAFAAASRSRVPSTITRRNLSSRPWRIATRWTTVSQPSAAARRVTVQAGNDCQGSLMTVVSPTKFFRGEGGGGLGHGLKLKFAEALSILDHERNVVCPHFKRRARSLSDSGRAVPEAGIKEAR